MESAPLQRLVEDVPLPDKSQLQPAGMHQRNAIILFPPDSTLPSGWQIPWINAGWVVSSCASSEGIPAALHGRGESALVALPWAKFGRSASGTLDRAVQALGAANDGKAARPALVGGTLRRSDFLSQLNVVAESDSGTFSVLMAIRVDQAQGIGADLDRTAVFDIEESISARMASVLQPQDAITIWLEFGFGVFVQRGSADEIRDLANRLCTTVAAQPFMVAGEPMALSISVGLALSPSARPTDPAQAWFATAHAAQGIANRHGGNRFEGVLSREYEPMSAERVLIIREWVDDAKAGNNVIVEFQPLMSASADPGNLYSVHAKLRDLRAPLGGVYRREYLRLARDAGSMVMIDRISLFNAFETLEQEHRAGRKTRLLVPVEIETLRGLAWRWLVEELRRRPHLRSRLIVEIEATSELTDKDNLMRIVRLRRFGVRVCLCEHGQDLAQLPVWSKLPCDFLRLAHSALRSVSDADIHALARELRSRGRQLIVSSVKDTDAVRRLAGLGVDYLRGQALAATGPRLDYGFSPAR